MKEKKRTSPFPSHLKNFARSLHFHSPAAYEMVRRSFLKCLPCVETLNSWNCSKNYKPGISEEIIEHVSQIVQNELKNGKKCVFNLTFDEMYIKKFAFYCKISHKWKGLVDLGGQLEECDEKGNNKKASKSLVFMLVNINGNFKTPVAYYLSDSLTGDNKSILLKDLLIKLHEKKIDVVSVTFDGDESNEKACKLLNANFDVSNEKTFKPFFPHPTTHKPVYVFFDACHMLKLVRNYFAQKGPIIYNGKEYIDWNFIRKINDIQYEEEMHCACKIRNRHVNFYNEKMKVFLAAQVLSSSTSFALQFLEHDINNVNFKGASSTAKFCKVFNDIFDVLNAKNKFCKSPGKNGITEKMLPELKQKIDEWIDYIKKLEVNVTIKPRNSNKQKENINDKCNIINIVRKPVITATTVKTGFVGFIICLTNLYSLCESFFKERIVDYVLSYKLSQDHVEMFFALIRRMNGFSNNPTTVQFESAYKKLLLNNMNVTVPTTANCTPQDETFIISHINDASMLLQTNVEKQNKNTVQSSKENQKKKRIRAPRPSKMSSFPINEFLHSNYSVLEHDYSKKDAWIDSEYLDEVIKHTAGAVVHSIRKKIHCTKCLDMLYSKPSNKSKLTTLKNRGGLTFASDDVNFICHYGEKILRQYKHVLLTPNINFKLVTETLKILPTSILDDNDHVFDQVPLYDHRQ